ncbi:zinc finger SWIM domain-containing protein 7 isoform X2 [Rhineura floridana]|uniref:zinc finger SWIM domain-containing protein 7 isoform X2 n=1 Tax=Rhineura floridana TaxID=261503 RepID=UPI002AC81D1E|nr:zinc finger SWIM domain-containing protein 7 isoform X2 [Rhineura floridana]
MDATLPALAEELLKEIEKAFRETSHVPDDLLMALKFIFGASALPALDLVDRQSVTRMVSPSGRTVYQVAGSSGKLYTCYASCHFCTCPAFTFSVLRKGDSLVVTLEAIEWTDCCLDDRRQINMFHSRRWCNVSPALNGVHFQPLRRKPTEIGQRGKQHHFLAEDKLQWNGNTPHGTNAGWKAMLPSLLPELATKLHRKDWKRMGRGSIEAQNEKPACGGVSTKMRKFHTAISG